MGRPRLEERVEGFTPDTLYDTYMPLRNQKKVARHFGISVRSVGNYCRQWGITGFSYKGAMAFWLRDHPGVPLPRTVRGIMEVTGLSRDTVKSYLYRRRQGVVRKVGGWPQLSALRTLLKTTRGVWIPTQAIASSESLVDRFGHMVTIRATLRSGETVFFKKPVTEWEKIITVTRGEEEEDVL